MDESINRVRYNAAYPRSACDQHGEGLASRAQHGGWFYLDLWNAVPLQHFHDPGLHLSIEGEHRLLQRPVPMVQDIACDTKP